jgi:hypothetical protein
MLYSKSLILTSNSHWSGWSIAEQFKLKLGSSMKLLLLLALAAALMSSTSRKTAMPKSSSSSIDKVLSEIFLALSSSIS